MRDSRSIPRWWVPAWVLLVALAGCVPVGLLSLPMGDDGDYDYGDVTTGGASYGDGGGDAGTALTGGCLGLGDPTDSIHRQVFEQLNTYRQLMGRSPLQYSVTLQRAADAHTRDMYERGFMFDDNPHTNPDGDGPGDRAVAAGFCHAYVGENLASSQNGLATASQVMVAWQNSAGHDRNLLEPDFKYVGVGYYYIRVGVNEYRCWGQLFAFDVP